MTDHIQALVIGGGISGLACAYALRQRGIDVQLFEAAAHPGGLIRSIRRDGYLLELGPQSFLGTAPILALCRELGIENQLIQAPAKSPRFVLVNGRLREVPLSPPAFFTSPLFSFGTKWSLLRDVFGRSTPPVEEESITAFVRRKFSPELLEKLVGPFVSGIYAGDPEKLSLRSAFPQLYEAERDTGSIVRGMMRSAKASSSTQKQQAPRPKLQAFREGNETLIHALATKLGQALHRGVTVEAIRCNNPPASPSPNFSVTLNKNGLLESVSVNHLILATPTNVNAKLLAPLQPAFESLLGTVEYAPVIVASLGYHRKDISHGLDGFGFLVPRSAGLRLLGTVWNSSLFPRRAPEGHTLLTSFVGGVTDSKAVDLPPTEIVALVHREMASLLQLREPPVFSNVTLYPRAIPQYNLGHSERLAALEELRRKIPGLWFIGNYLRGPAIGACVEQALAVAQEIGGPTSS